MSKAFATVIIVALIVLWLYSIPQAPSQEWHDQFRRVMGLAVLFFVLVKTLLD